VDDQLRLAMAACCVALIASLVIGRLARFCVALLLAVGGLWLLADYFRRLQDFVSDLLEHL
jgi:hypothetical protein